MGVVQYDSVEGEIYGDSSSAQYLRDALGSVTGTATPANKEILNTYRYRPSGLPLSSSGSSPSPNFRWVGTAGYRATPTSHSQNYVRARHYGQNENMWTTVDPLWPSEPSYVYVRGSAVNWTDPTGMQASQGGYGPHNTPWCGCPPGYPYSCSGTRIGGDPNRSPGDPTGPWSCLWCNQDAVNEAKADALTLCESLGHKSFEALKKCMNEGPGGAVRHCIWACQTTRDCGQRCAKWVTTSHEEEHAGSPVGSYPYLDTCMDLVNNTVGYGLAGKSGSCGDLCTSALKQGKLSLLQGMGFPKRVVDCSKWLPKKHVRY